MSPHHSRRSLLGAVGLGAVSGCLSGLNVGDTDDTETCDVETGRWRGEADPTSTVVEVQRTEDLPEQCADEASEAVFAELTDSLDVDIEGKEWVTYGWSYDDEYVVVVRIKSVLDRNGNVRTCPDSAFDRSEMRANLPSEVTAVLERSESDESYECTHAVELRVEEVRLD